MLKKWLSSILVFSMIFGSANLSTVSAATTPIPIYRDQSKTVDARVNDLLSQMTLDEKIGQMVQAERLTATPAEVANYSLGSILSGGGSVPTPNTAESWANMVDNFQKSAMASKLGIPILYGVDAVHGDNNVVGATIFPHNIGLGASKNASLVEKIGHATAEEVRATGVNWTFSTVLGVLHNERWGRTYETFGENSQLVSSLGAAYVKGLQGDNPTATLKRSDAVIATAKHFLGEGLTTDGVNQGNAVINDAFNPDGTVKINVNGELLNNTVLKNELLPPYQAAIAAGVRTIMVSFNSINGVKCHGNADVITKVLKGPVSKGGLGFTGIVVSDWEGIAQVAGTDDAAKIKASINAGMDMAMVPNTWKTFITTLKTLVNNGDVTVSRIDDAVTRILKVKFEMGLFEDPYAQRSLLNTVGSAAHRDIARQAVRESLVLLKNNKDIVGQLKNKKSILVAGKSADDIGIQSGGWTISWQGQAGNVTPGTTILQGIKNTVGSDVKVGYNKNGIANGTYDAAVVVIGENPYAETNGDKTATALTLDSTDLATINNIKTAHPDTPIVAVLVTGRPITIADQIDNLDGIVEAWLPGTEGKGVAEVLFGSYDFLGKLPITWPWRASDIGVKLSDPTKVLFEYGRGLKKGETTPIKTTKPGLPPVIDKSLPIPGIIRAVDYASSNAGLDKPETCSDTGDGNGSPVGGTDQGGMWSGVVLNYDVNVAEDAQYQVDFRVAVGGNSSGLSDILQLYSGNTLLTTADGKDSGGWQNWVTITAKSTLNLKAGKQTLTFKAKDWGFNFNWLKFTKVGPYVEPPTPPASTPIKSTGKVLQTGVVSVTESSAVQAASQSWYDSPKEIPNKLSEKSKLDITLPGTDAIDDSKVTAIKVEDSKEYQSILGIGTSIEGSTIANLNKLSPAVKTDFLKKLVDPKTGAGMSLLRVTIGTPDFTGDVFHTYDDMPAGQKDDANLSNFSIQSDIDDGTIATIKEILAINPNVKLFASSWTPPGWMKEETPSSKANNNSDGLLLRGGKLSDAHIEDLAKYYTRYLEEYAKLGIPIYAMTLQNEPMLEINYPSCAISPEQERLLSLAIKKDVSESSLLKSKSINPKIWAFDHNFDGAANYVPPILNSDNGVDGIAYHPYGGEPTAMSQLHALYPNIPAYLTERSLWGTKGADEIARYFRNYASSYNAWVTMLDSNQSPMQWVGTPDPTMFVRDANIPDSYWACPEYYIEAQFSKFVRPGAVRVDSNYGSTDTVTNVSFKNPDGTIATIVINQTNREQTFKILNHGTQILATIPAQNVATYQWTPDTSVVVVPAPVLSSVNTTIAANTASVLLNLTGGSFAQNKVSDITLSGDMIANGYVSAGSIEYVSPNQVKINLTWSVKQYYGDTVLTVNLPANSYTDSSAGGILTTDISCKASSTTPTSNQLSTTKVELTEANAYRNIGSLFSNVEIGNRLDYYLDVAEGGDYTITYNIQNSSSVSNAIKVSNGTGITIAGNISTLNIAGGDSQLGLKSTVKLSAGLQTLRFEATSTGFTVKDITIVKKVAGQVIKADNTNDATVILADSLFNGYKYSVQSTNGVTNLGYTVAGSYFDYSLDVKKQGCYLVTLNYATTVGAALGVLSNEAGESLSSVSLPSTGDWGAYKDSSPMPVSLAAGIQTLRVSVSGDGYNLKSITLKYVLDTEKPVITGHDGLVLLGDSKVDLIKVLGINATDDFNGDLTSSIKVEGTVDSTKLGTYPVKVSVRDTTGNKTEKDFKVLVKNDITAPVISGNNVMIGIKSSFNPIKILDIKVMDDKDGDITSDKKTVITQSVNTKVYGVYTVKVSAVDKALNASERTFIVRVIDLTTVDVARAITTIVAPTKDVTKLILPVVPKGYSLSIKSSSNTAVITTNGTIIPPIKDTTVAVVLKVINKADGTTEDTISINVVVPAKTTAATVAAGITSIVSPAKDDRCLKLPTVPQGYKIAIKSVNPKYVIATNGTITPPNKDTKVAVIFRVTKTEDGTFADTISINVVVPAKTALKSKDATLKSIIMGGKTLAGFESSNTRYTVKLPIGTTKLPKVEAIATKANSTIFILQANPIMKVAIIVVTAEDKITTKIYSVKFY
ncbi:MAG: glycoside hydrolase family 3 C-terminal domain-containing protein [Clostridiaceae bacterium]|nr:glycoside hydrolase family 3 C-terminal domain-containing protein [Clostridiaceae bacterium]